MKKYFHQIFEHLQILGSWLINSLRPNSAGDFTPHRRYRLSLDRTSSLTRLASVSGSKGQMITLAVLAFVMTGAIWLAVFIYTPLRNLLPARFTVELRDKYNEMDVRLDSVADATRIYRQYTSNIQSILTDSIPQTPSTSTRDIPDIQDIPVDSLLVASEREKMFVRRFEDEERFNLSVLSPIAADGMTFYAPVSALSAEITEKKADIPNISVLTPKTTGVSAIYRGTVLSKNYTTGRGFTLIIQHPNDFISVYSGLTEAFTSRGDKVAVGQRIGLTSTTVPFNFELWHNGTPLKPSDYIAF